MQTLFNNYSAVEMVALRRNFFHELAKAGSHAEIKVPALGMVSLLRDICTLSLSINEQENYKLHHVVEDTDKFIPERHIAALENSVNFIGEIIGTEIELKFDQGETNNGLIIPQPPPKRVSSDIGGLVVEGDNFYNFMFETASGTLDPNLTLKQTIGSILALQSLIEESNNRAFVLVMKGMQDFAYFNYFVRSMQAMDKVIRTIGDINDANVGVHYYPN